MLWSCFFTYNVCVCVCFRVYVCVYPIFAAIFKHNLRPSSIVVFQPFRNVLCVWLVVFEVQYLYFSWSRPLSFTSLHEALFSLSLSLFLSVPALKLSLSGWQMLWWTALYVQIFNFPCSVAEGYVYLGYKAASLGLVLDVSRRLETSWSDHPASWLCIRKQRKPQVDIPQAKYPFFAWDAIVFISISMP
jgi:hypothetical protein